MCAPPRREDPWIKNKPKKKKKPVSRPGNPPTPFGPFPKPKGSGV